MKKEIARLSTDLADSQNMQRKVCIKKRTKLRRNIGDMGCGQYYSTCSQRYKKKPEKKKEKFEEKMGENFPELKKDSNPHIQETLQNLSTIKTKQNQTHI